jgi:hypothetical protein
MEAQRAGRPVSHRATSAPSLPCRARHPACYQVRLRGVHRFMRCPPPLGSAGGTLRALSLRDVSDIVFGGIRELNRPCARRRRRHRRRLGQRLCRGFHAGIGYRKAEALDLLRAENLLNLEDDGGGVSHIM